MKVLILSDSHGRIGPMQAVLDKLHPHISAVIHLGDNLRDALSLEQLCAGAGDVNGVHAAFFCVPGNCDGYYEETSRIITLNGRKILITHGHEYGVKGGISTLKQAAAKMNAEACFYGHTHQAYVKHHKNILFLNPGSIGEPRYGSGASYAVVDVPKDGAIEGNIISLSP